MYSISVVLIGFSVLLTFVSAIEFKDCGSKLGVIKSLAVSNCEHLPCLLKHNTNVTVTMVFDAKANIAHARTKVYGEIGIVKVPFPMDDSNACDFMKCPISSGTTEKYNMVLYVKKEYPEIQLAIQWELLKVDKNGDDMITCFTIPAKIVG